MLSRLFGGRLALQADQVNAFLVDLFDALQAVEGGLFFVRVLHLAHEKRLTTVWGVVIFGMNRLFLILMPMMTVG